MDNDNIARIFQKIAQLLEIKGENAYVTNAYQRAAESIRIYPDALEQMDIPTLKTIPRVGEAIAKKIDEINRTENLQFLDKLEKEVPPSLLEWLTIPGVGPKTVRRIWQTLHITTLEELKSATQQKALQALPGIGEKLETRILSAIEVL